MTTEITKPSVPPLAETIIDTDIMYGTIRKTLSALSHTTVDGLSSDDIDADLQAHTHKRYLPDTEIEMLHTNAVPMSEDDVKAFKVLQGSRETLQYRREQLKIPTKTLAETTGARVRVAYRLVRYMTHIRGIGGVGVPLVLSMSASNAQVNLFELPIPYDPTAGWYRGLSAVRNLLAIAEDSKYEYSYILNGDFYIAHGMSILPPPMHDGYFPQNNGKLRWEYRREQYTPKDYRADADGPLAIYLNICELLVRHLGIGEFDIEEQAAVAALLNPGIARLAWPCSDDIETFEEYVLLPHIGRIVTEKSQDSAIDTLKKDMGLTHPEAFDFVETYKTYSQQINVFDPERERSIMLGKLHRLAEKCSDSAAVTTELNSHKTILQILGLTRHDEDTNIDKRENLENALEAEIVGEAKQIEAGSKIITDNEDTDSEASKG